MWVQFYVIDRKCALMPALTAVFVDQKYELETWLRTQDRGAREKAADIRGMVLDRDRDCAAKIVRDILLPLVEALRMGDRSSPQMGNVYKTMMELYRKIDAVVRPLDDVLDGGVFDKDDLVTLEDIITKRWEYLHCPYHSVGYLGHPRFIDVDLYAADHDEFRDELLADLELVAGRLFFQCPEKAAKAMAQFGKYKAADSRYKSIVRRAAYPNHTTSYGYWDMFGHDLPELAYIFRRVLSKQIGIGDIERGHKVMKNTVFHKMRGALNPNKASEECATIYNQKVLDGIRENLQWYQYYEPVHATVLPPPLQLGDMVQGPAVAAAAPTGPTTAGAPTAPTAPIAPAAAAAPTAPAGPAAAAAPTAPAAGAE